MKIQENPLKKEFIPGEVYREIDSGGYYIFARIDYDKYSLISLCDGNRFCDGDTLGVINNNYLGFVHRKGAILSFEE